MKETPVSELRLNYRKVLELGLIISLLFHVMVFQVFKKSNVGQTIQNVAPGRIIVEDIPQTVLKKQVQAPLPPTIPIPSESDDLPLEKTLEIDDDIFDNINPPPPPPEGKDMPGFCVYDVPPVPVGGYGSIQKMLVYPEIARRAGIQGRVLIYAKVDKQGNVVKTQIEQSLGSNGCDEAAISAIKSVQWKPALQRDLPVTVWIAVPVEFKLQ